MNTEFGLLAAFSHSIIPVSDVCESFFGCKKQTAYQQIKAYTFPVPAFRMGDSNKNEFFVTVEDLARYVDQQRATAGTELEHLFCLFFLQFASFCRPYCSQKMAEIQSDTSNQ